MEKEILHRFFAGTASFEEEEAVCNWADASEENKEELIKERKYFDVLLLHNSVDKKKKATPVRRLYPTIREALKIAASIAVLVVSSLYIYGWVQPEEVTAYNKIVVPPGQRVNLTLSDGTSVWLNARTELLYPAAFTDKQRKVTLKGEGYFEVAKDHEKPFIVQTSKCDVKVLGTKFNVEAYDDTETFSTALMEGSVKLMDKKKLGVEVLLAPKQKAELKNGQFTVDAITDYDTYRWKEGLICFENILFTDLMKKFEKTYDIHIVNTNKKLDNYRCSGKFRMADGVDFVLHVLQRNAHFKFSRSGDNTIIYIK